MTQAKKDRILIRQCRAAAYRMDWDWFKSAFKGSRKDFEWDEKARRKHVRPK